MKLAFSNKQKMKMQYKHISKEERRMIEKLSQGGSSNKRIAEELGRSRSTIGRELKRNYDEGTCFISMGSAGIYVKVFLKSKNTFST